MIHNKMCLARFSGRWPCEKQRGRIFLFHFVWLFISQLFFLRRWACSNLELECGKLLYFSCCPCLVMCECEGCCSTQHIFRVNEFLDRNHFSAARVLVLEKSIGGITREMNRVRCKFGSKTVRFRLVDDPVECNESEVWIRVICLGLVRHNRTAYFW